MTAFRSALTAALDLLHRCNCCHTHNRNVHHWPSHTGKFRPDGKRLYLCGECAYGLCDFDCNGTPFRRREKDWL